jgi:hypothetical protein
MISNVKCPGNPSSREKVPVIPFKILCWSDYKSFTTNGLLWPDFPDRNALLCIGITTTGRRLKKVEINRTFDAMFYPFLLQLPATVIVLG